jgi:hypothetical protein
MRRKTQPTMSDDTLFDCSKLELSKDSFAFFVDRLPLPPQDVIFRPGDGPAFQAPDSSQINIINVREVAWLFAEHLEKKKVVRHCKN